MTLLRCRIRIGSHKNELAKANTTKETDNKRKTTKERGEDFNAPAFMRACRERLARRHVTVTTADEESLVSLALTHGAGELLSLLNVFVESDTSYFVRTRHSVPTFTRSINILRSMRKGGNGTGVGQ